MSGSYANPFTWEQAKKGPFCDCWRFRFIPRPYNRLRRPNSQKTTTKQHASIAGSSRPPEPEQHITSPCSLQSSEANQTQKSEMDRGGAASPPRGRRRSGRAGRGDDGGGGRTHCPATAEADPDGKGDEAGAPPRRRWRRRREESGTTEPPGDPSRQRGGDHGRDEARRRRPPPPIDKHCGFHAGE